MLVICGFIANSFVKISGCRNDWMAHERGLFQPNGLHSTIVPMYLALLGQT